jgi:hypothetical protein
MMAWVHATIGAAVGAAAAENKAAFVAGAVSHGFADLVPHRDYNLAVELPLLTVTIGYLVLRYGYKSPQVAGAAGGVAPDIENGLELLGAIHGSAFPTHTKKSWFIGHGHKVIFLAVLCLWLADKLGRRV